MLAALMAVGMSACFTGIESTPKITAKDVKRENIPVRPEDSFLDDIKAEPFSSWTSGKSFYVTDNKFGSLLLPDPATDLSRLGGSVIRYVDNRKVSDLTGNTVYELHFLTENCRKISYRTTQTASMIDKTGNAGIPFLIDMDVVESVRNRLLGQKYYVITSSWYDLDLKSEHGRKFVPVTIESVDPGNNVYSVILTARDDRDTRFKLFLSVGNDLKSLRHFGSLFSFKNPKDLYPLITDGTWNNIINGKVAENMTKDECRLALGAPDNVDRRAGYSALHEIWTYAGGVYLVFEDGLLKSFRQ